MSHLLLWRLYGRVIASHPRAAAAATAFSVGAVGDACAQWIQAREDHHHTAGPARMVVTGLYNGSVAGAIMLPWYRFLDRAVCGRWAAITKVVVHQVCGCGCVCG